LKKKINYHMMMRSTNSVAPTRANFTTIVAVLSLLSLCVVRPVDALAFSTPSVLKNAIFGLEGFIAKRKVNKDLDPSATKFLVDADEVFATSSSDDKSSSGKVVSFDHTAWDSALKRHACYTGTINGITTNLVDYRGMAKDPGVALYKKSLANVDIEAMLEHSRGSPSANNELLALYINAYNCLCIGHVTKYYTDNPKIKLPMSITKVTEKMLDYKNTDIWDVPAGFIGGQSMTLNDIEHKILRSYWDDPRVHASIVCASVSCPNLRPEAFVCEKLNQQLDEQAVQWVNDPSKGIRIDSESQVTMSRIFLWFSDDFQPAGPLSWAQRYYKGNKQDLASKTQIEYFPYEWSLNTK